METTIICRGIHRDYIGIVGYIPVTLVSCYHFNRNGGGVLNIGPPFA